MTSTAEQVTEAKNKGNAAFSAGNFEEAVKHFTEAINLDPSNHILFSNRSGAFASLKKYSDALEDALKTVSLKSDWGKGYSRLGTAYFFLGNLDEATKAYQKGLEMEPENAQLKQGLADVHAATQQRGLGGLGALFGPDVWIKIRNNPRLSPFLNQPDFVAIVNDLQQNPQHISHYLQDTRITSLLGALLGIDKGDSGSEPTEVKKEEEPPKHREQHKKEEPKEQPKNESKLSPEQIEANKSKEEGNNFYKQKNFSAAINSYNKAIELDPENLTYKLNRSAAYFESGEYDNCLQECQVIIDEGRAKHAPYDLIAKAFFRIGNVHMKHNEYVSAVTAYQKSLTEHRTPQTLSALQKAEKLKAEKEIQNYLDPQKALEEKEKGNEFFKKQQFPEAIKHYTEAIRRSPQDHVLYSNRAAAYSKLGEFQLTLQDCDKCLSISPSFVKAYIRKGNTQFIMKEYHKALETFDAGLKYDESNEELMEGASKTVQAIQAMQSGQSDEEAIKRALSDPEVQAILQDPAMRQILETMQNNPRAVQGFMSDPQIAPKIQKLIAAGILRTR